MRYIERVLGAVCERDLQAFPVLTLTGPRQSGKTTLLRHLRPDWGYVSLEDPSSREFATTDPAGFLQAHPGRVILDEVQRTPDLLSRLQVEVDRDPSPGRFILSGSHNLLLLQHVSQTLAGRTVMRNLLPFSRHEASELAPDSLNEQLFLGGFPAVYRAPHVAVDWLDSYVQTYVERDVRMIRQVADLAAFQRFLRLCAARAGQLLDLSGIGADAGVKHNTVSAWIGVLEAGFIAFRLLPYHQNFSKRLIRSPKLYFYDTGVLCRLLGITSAAELTYHPMRGAIFENWCVLEALKGRLHRGVQPGLWFWRDRVIEVDLLMELTSTSLAAVECKSSATAVAEFIDSAVRFGELATGVQVTPTVVYGGDETQGRSRGRFVSWRDFARELALGTLGAPVVP